MCAVLRSTAQPNPSAKLTIFSKVSSLTLSIKISDSVTYRLHRRYLKHSLSKRGAAVGLLMHVTMYQIRMSYVRPFPVGSANEQANASICCVAAPTETLWTGRRHIVVTSRPGG